MSYVNTNGEKKGFGRTIKDDLRSDDLHRNISKEFGEISDFFIDEDRKIRLKRMNPVRRFIYSVFYLFEALFYKLTPFRRILVVAGIILILIARNNNGNADIVGGILLLYVILLELKDKLVAKHELEAGHQVQNALKPESQPSVPGWDIFLFTKSANDVGGDLVDYQKINGARHSLCLGDVSGKGLSAALLMAKLQATIRAIYTDFSSLSDFGNKLNSIFHRDTPANFFASLVFLEIEDNSPRIKYFNAGHLPPVIIRSDSIEEMPKGGVALGLTKNISCAEQSAELKKGEIFFIYSDGLTEAQNEYGQFFGSENTLKLLRKLSGYSSRDAVGYVNNAIDMFKGEKGLTDDLSMVVLRRTE